MRGALLTAGRQLLTESGFDPVSLRDVGERAGANQAMVRYYFGDKHGFLTAMLDEGFDELMSAAEGARSLRVFLERLIAKLNDMPWLPILLTQSVYLSDELRARFVTHHAPRLVGGIRSVAGKRKGVGSSYLPLSIIAMLIFPQLARPVVARVFDVQFDAAFARSYGAHVAALCDPEGKAHG